jgi:hypothetical protein
MSAARPPEGAAPFLGEGEVHEVTSLEEMK